MADLPVVPVLLLQLLDGDTIGQQWVELRPVLGATQMLTVVSPSLALEDGLMRGSAGFPMSRSSLKLGSKRGEI